MWQGPRLTLELLSFGDVLVLTCGAATVTSPAPSLPAHPVDMRSHPLCGVGRPWRAGSAPFTDGQTESRPEDFAFIAQQQDWASKAFPGPAASLGSVGL